MASSKLKITGAWSGVLELDLNAWTVPMLREQIAEQLECEMESIKLICAGKVLQDDDGTKKLIESGVRNNAKIWVIRVLFDHGKKLMSEKKSNEFQRLRAAAASLAKRSVENFNLRFENQHGEKLQLGSENNQRAIMMGLMFHGKAKKLVKSRKYEDALEVLAMAEDAFRLCDSNVLEQIDNFPELQIDTVWCYFMLKDISKLSVAGKRLEKARNAIERDFGKRLTRLKLLRTGVKHTELALHLRLELLEGIVAYHTGDLEKSEKSLFFARLRYLQLRIPDEELSRVMGMGYEERSAKMALRMSNFDVERALDFLVEEKVNKQLKIDENTRRRKAIICEKEFAAESLRRNENGTQKAVEDLKNPKTNSNIQVSVESRETKKRLRQGEGDDGYERDAEMEDELFGYLQTEDGLSDYDIELSREKEAIDEYLALLVLLDES